MDKASTDNPSITRFISSAIKIPEPGVVHYNPFATDEKWSVTYIRHQQWESYELHKYYTVSISAIGSYNINPDKLKPLVITAEKFKRHHEVEVSKYSCKQYHDATRTYYLIAALLSLIHI